MHIHVDYSGTAQALAGLISTVAAQPDVGLVLVLACDKNGFTAAEVDPLLKACPKPLLGGVFPQLMHNAQRFEQGTIVAGLSCAATVTTVAGLSDPQLDMDAILATCAAPAGDDSGTLLVFVDGLARRIGGLMDALFNHFGLAINYIGGGAGSLSFKPSPCVLSNDGMLVDAAVFAMTDVVSGIGVAHGWESIKGPFKVTESDRNTIISLDWRPAFEVYREVVELHSGQSFGDHNFFDLAKAYPFGIARLDSEMVVRDPLILDGTALVCVGEVPVDSYVHILHGNAGMLVAAAGAAGRLGSTAYAGTRGRESLLFIDCISRSLFLGDGFSAELDAVKTGQALIGALTLGEIANSGGDFLEFLNKTAVVGYLDA
jgi:hypothetical protein